MSSRLYVRGRATGDGVRRAGLSQVQDLSGTLALEKRGRADEQAQAQRVLRSARHKLLRETSAARRAHGERMVLQRI